jgi:serine/threonine protein kinase
LSTESSPEETANAGSRLDTLMFDYLERVDRGDSAEAVLEELCQAHPQDSAALRRGVALLMDVRLHPGPPEDGLPERVGPFRLLRRLGAGGMGVVYLAQQQRPTRKVALKLVRPDQLWFEGYRERFTREIESAGRLAHHGIAPVYEMGEHDGVPWFSQEYVVGASLSEILENVPGRSPESLTGRDFLNAMREVVETGDSDASWDEHFFRGRWVDVCLRIAKQVADALEHAHERGVLHRDVKPSNILLTPAGRAVLVDFGLANLQGTERLTQSGAQLGSLHYMPPEQIDGKRDEIGPGSDVYSLGVTLYELLTLRAPYASKLSRRECCWARRSNHRPG